MEGSRRGEMDLPAKRVRDSKHTFTDPVFPQYESSQYNTENK